MSSKWRRSEVLLPLQFNERACSRPRQFAQLPQTGLAQKVGLIISTQLTLLQEARRAVNEKPRP
jgi:hypothetical protein